MKKDEFRQAIDARAQVIDSIKELAHEVHASVNQHYDKTLPYAVHLDMVADNVKEHGACVCACADDVVPMLFGAYFHDSIEDARLTYNNVYNTALRFMNERQALMAAEIVFALTNEKGRTRAERANDRYYAGIRATAYAPMVKMADRLANITYSCTHSSDANEAMKAVYSKEYPHFIEAVTADSSADARLAIPPGMKEAIEDLIK